MAIKKREAVIRATNMKWDYYARNYSLQDLADKYGVSRTMCFKIVNRPTTYGVTIKKDEGRKQ